GSVMIDIGLDRDDHGSISAIAIGKELEPLDAKADSRIKLNGLMDRILVVKTK
ncbi:hypothetical protein A2U01_0081451, partial [Trifolium medium]|nr:hypothetical protein [Trifolium medium]